MKNTFIIRGTIEAQSPLATANKELIDQGKKLYGAYSPIPVPSFDSAKGKSLYFPATGLRGTLRRALRDIMRDNLIKRGSEGLLLDEHYFLTLGGIKGSGPENRSTVAQEEHWRIRNVLLSLFGAGDAGALNFVTGKLAIDNAICEPNLSPMTIAGTRTDDLYRDRTGLNFLVSSELKELVTRAEGNTAASAIRKQINSAEIKLRTAKRNDTETQPIQDELNELNEKLEKTLKASNASSVSVGMPLAGFQAIPPFSVMDHKIKLFNATAVELGGMLAALGKLSLNPTVGGHIALGCGEIKANYDVLKVTADGLVKLASIEIGGFEPMTVAEQTEEFDQAIKAFADYLDSEDFDISIPHAL